MDSFEKQKKKLKPILKTQHLEIRNMLLIFVKQLALTASLNINTCLGTVLITLKPKMSHNTNWIVRATSKPEKYLVMKNSYFNSLKEINYFRFPRKIIRKSKSKSPFLWLSVFHPV